MGCKTIVKITLSEITHIFIILVSKVHNSDSLVYSFHCYNIHWISRVNGSKVYWLPWYAYRWVSGVDLVTDPFIWAACVRYMHTSQISDRVPKPSEPFLLIHKSPLMTAPQFFDCVPASSALNFRLASGTHGFSMAKVWCVTSIHQRLAVRNSNKHVSTNIKYLMLLTGQITDNFWFTIRL